MKKNISLLLIVMLILLSITACGREVESEEVKSKVITTDKNTTEDAVSKEENAEIAETKSTDDAVAADPTVDEFVPEPPVTTTKSVDFVVGAPVVDKQIFDWTDSQVLEAAEAYRNVLMGQANFSFFYSNPEYNDKVTNLDQLIDLRGKMDSFSIIDLDNDSFPEVVLFSNERNIYTYYIFKYHKEHVYVYDRDIRGFNVLRMDGTFSWSNSGFESGIGSLLFQGTTTETDDKVISDTREPNSANHMFSINGQRVTREEEQKASEYQDSKPKATWYEFTDENTEKYLSASGH